MTDAPHQQPGPAEALRQRRLRRFSVLVTLTLIVACNAVIFAGLWASGINVETLFRTPDLFNPGRDVCLRYNWRKVSGVPEPIRVCYEWINLSDPSGNTHTFQPDTDIVLGADGKLHYARGADVDARLPLLLAFIVAVLAGGIALSKFLIARYRMRLDEPER